MSTIIGIDLGTSTIEAAIYSNGKPVLIADRQGRLSMPSAVGIDDKGMWVFGERARSQYLISPENTAIEIKRKIGSDEYISLAGKDYTAVELSAKLLEYVRWFASESLGEEITRAVISVPAYFDDRQRQETLKAGTMAGFNVERIINEPTAAAVSYGLGHLAERSHILVYDLGGGTFDVTLLEMYDGVLEVKATSGNNKLGGKDFDECIQQVVTNRFFQKYGISLTDDIYAMAKIKEASERCKIVLSEQDSCRIYIPFIASSPGGEPLAIDEDFTREQLELYTTDLVNLTHRPIDIAFSDSQVLPSEVDQVILVGGATRMPMIAKDIEQYLGIRPSVAVHPDFAVAEGAAIHAAIMQGLISTENGLVMTDVNPYTLGIRTVVGFDDDVMSVIIPRNVTIPTSRTEIYHTSSDGQESAKIEVFQGDDPKATANHFLGDFWIMGIPKGEAGSEAVMVKFSYNLNGCLQVEANVMSNGAKASIEINVANCEPDAEIDVEKWKDSPFATEFRTVLRRAQNSVEEAEYELDAADIQELVYELKRAIIKGELDNARALEHELLELLEN